MALALATPMKGTTSENSEHHPCSADIKEDMPCDSDSVILRQPGGR